MQEYFRNWVEINLDYIGHNVKAIQNILPPKTKIMAVIKDNAYGHGSAAIAHELCGLGIHMYAVSNINEAIHLREHSIGYPILILGYTPPAQFYLLHKYNLIQTLVSYAYTQKLDNFCRRHHCIIECHVKVDTGMGRVGFIYDGSKESFCSIAAAYTFKNINITGTFTHFASSDSLQAEDIAYTLNQNSLFRQLIYKLKNIGINPGKLHTQSSSAILNYSMFEYDYVRPGMLLLGIPSGEIVKDGRFTGLKPVLQLKTKVTLVKEIAKGCSVSYGRNYKATKPSIIASLSIGYGDGYPRILSNKHMKVLVRGQFAEIAGNICMDQMMIDVTHIPDVKEGDTVTLIGSDGDFFISINEIAEKAHTINNEIAVNINSRVERIYYKNNIPFNNYINNCTKQESLKLQYAINQ